MTAVIRSSRRSTPAPRRAAACPGADDADLHRPAARHRRRLPLAVVRRRGQAAGRRLPADDQDDHRAAALRDAGRRHRRHRRPEVDGPHRPQGDHLLRGGDDDCAVPRARARQHLQAGRRAGDADRRRHQRGGGDGAEPAARVGHLPAPVSRPRSSTRWRAATSCSWSCSRPSSASPSPRSARKGSRSSTCSRAPRR